MLPKGDSLGHFEKRQFYVKTAVFTFWATCKLLGYYYFILSKQ